MAGRVPVLRQGEQYAIYDAKGEHTSALSDLPSTLERTLSDAEHRTILHQSNADSLNTRCTTPAWR
jgi:hypothetical protein